MGKASGVLLFSAFAMLLAWIAWGNAVKASKCSVCHGLMDEAIIPCGTAALGCEGQTAEGGCATHQSTADKALVAGRPVSPTLKRHFGAVVAAIHRRLLKRQ